MNSSLSIDELMTRVMPGGVLLATLYFLYGDSIAPQLRDGFDVFYTFLFFCCAFIAGEILQLIAHLLEFIIDLFFRCRRPSQVFLYRDNPVVRSEHHRGALLAQLNLSQDELSIFDTNYSGLPILFGRSKENNDLSQSIFWRLFANVSDSDGIKQSNRSYLFGRVIMVDFFIISILLTINEMVCLGSASLVVCLLFLWRTRGIAKGLVFKTVMLNLK